MIGRAESTPHSAWAGPGVAAEAFPAQAVPAPQPAETRAAARRADQADQWTLPTFTARICEYLAVGWLGGVPPVVQHASETVVVAE